MKVTINHVVKQAFNKGFNVRQQIELNKVSKEIVEDHLKKHGITPATIIDHMRTEKEFGTEPISDESIRKLQTIKFI